MPAAPVAEKDRPVFCEVMLSVPTKPVSSIVARSRAVGAAGAVLSCVTDKAALAADVLPAKSANLAVTEVATLAVMAVLMVTFTKPALRSCAVITDSPIKVAPLNNCALPPASTPPEASETLKVGLFRLVMLSVFTKPESLASTMSGAAGAVGATVSITMAWLSARFLPAGIATFSTLPNMSLACQVPVMATEVTDKSALFTSAAATV